MMKKVDRMMHAIQERSIDPHMLVPSADQHDHQGGEAGSP
jgi:hypothetical protein